MSVLYSVLRKTFKYVIGYSEKQFYPHLATSFQMKLCQKLFIECFSVLRAVPGILTEEEGLGAHASVIVAHSKIGIRYFWCHNQIRPFGDAIPLQCPNCMVVRAFKFRPLENSSKYEVKCQNCQWVKNRDILHLERKGFPTSGTGCGHEIIYGTKGDMESMYNAPRSAYDM